MPACAKINRLGTVRCCSAIYIDHVTFLNKTGIMADSTAGERAD